MTYDIIGNLPTGQGGILPIAKATMRNDTSGRQTGGFKNMNIQDEAVGARLTALREMLRMTKSEMADTNEIDRTNYGRFEAGTRMLPIEIGYRLASRYGVTLDWLYRGRWEGLSLETAERLRSIS